MLDLDAARETRLEAARAARGEEKGPEELKLGGKVITLLPAELPMDVLEPLTKIDIDTALLFRSVLDVYKSTGQKDAAASVESLIGMLVDLVLTNPKLPQELVGAVKDMGRRVLGEDGYIAFVAARPSLQDGAALVKGLATKYSLSSGKSSAPSTSSNGGRTSTPISGTTSADSTSTGSGGAPDSPASSESDDSSATSNDSPPKPS